MLKLSWIHKKYLVDMLVSIAPSLLLYMLSLRDLLQSMVCALCGDITVRHMETRIINFLQCATLKSTWINKESILLFNNFWMYKCIGVSNDNQQQSESFGENSHKPEMFMIFSNVLIRARYRVPTRSQDRYIVMNDLRTRWKSAYTTASQKNVLISNSQYIILVNS